MCVCVYGVCVEVVALNEDSLCLRSLKTLLLGREILEEAAKAMTLSVETIGEIRVGHLSFRRHVGISSKNENCFSLSVY